MESITCVYVNGMFQKGERDEKATKCNELETDVWTGCGGGIWSNGSFRAVVCKSG